MTDVSPNKRVIMVLAMARCGTSAITRGLKAIGVSLGEELHQADARNPKGFWEDNDVTYKINRGILRIFKYPWICTNLADTLRTGANTELNAIKQFAVNLVRSRLQDTHCWGFKDTNTSSLLPFWREVVAEAEVRDSYVIALRNPLSCAYSNIKHSNLELEAGLLAWLKSMVLSIDGTHGKNRVVVSYDSLLENPMGQLERMHAQLGLPTPMDSYEVDLYANKFIDSKLHHHTYSAHELRNNPAVAAVPLVLRVYNLLTRLADDQLLFTDAEFESAWSPIKAEFDALYSVYQRVHALRTENYEMERKLRKIRQSLSWKLFLPLRMLSRAWRVRRRGARIKALSEG
jgi:hypothetical protein